MRVNIRLKKLDKSIESLGYNSVMMYLYKGEINPKNYKGDNIIYAGKISDVPASLLDVTLGEGGNELIGLSKHFVVFNEANSSINSINLVLRHYPNHQYCLIMKDRISENYPFN